MKKIYTLLLITFPFLANSQTITQADLPTAGIGYTMNVDSTYNGVISAGGTGLNWDFSSLQTSYTDTTAFMAAAGTPYAAAFPGANLASFDWTDTSYAYFTNSSTGFYLNGVGTATDTVPYTPPLLYVPVPFSFGSSMTSSSTITIDQMSGGSHYRFVIHYDNTYEGDATGSLITPVANYNSVLRVKTTTVEYDTLSIDTFGVWLTLGSSVSQSTEFNYLTSGNTVNLVMNISGDSLGTQATESQYLSGQINLSSQPLTIRNFKQEPYPNPATNLLKFDLTNENTDLIIYDMNGAQVLRYQGNFGGVVDVQKLNSGVYHYKLSKTDNTESGSFVVQH
jgi:hypothetical protein